MKIIKSLRKSITMKIDEAGDLIVRAPVFTSKKSIEEFVDKHKNWIEEKKQLVLERVKNFTEWEKFYFFWEEYELKLTGTTKKIKFDGMNFYLNPKYKKDASKLFADFYKDEARNYIETRIYQIAGDNNLSFEWVKITSAKTRWGSCSSKRTISFSYRLIMAPLKTVDYVIVHELAHLVHMNHWKKFWDLVEKMMKGLYPGDYRVHKDWLKKHGNNLIF